MSSVILDDRDPRIVYSSGWNMGGLPTEYNSTTTYTDSRGATATLTFNGVRVGVYGTIGSSNSNKTAPQSQYQLDGNQPLFYQPRLNSLSQRNQQFYQSPELPKEQHTLIVTNLINGSSLFALDYFVIMTGNTLSTGSEPTGTPNGTKTLSARNISIISGTIASVVGCALLLLGILYFRRHRKKKVEEDLSMVQSAWMDSPHTSYRTPVTPSTRPNKFATFSSAATTPLSPPPRKDVSLSVPSTIPSTSYHASSSSYVDDLAAPPEYKP